MQASFWAVTSFLMTTAPYVLDIKLALVTDIIKLENKAMMHDSTVHKNDLIMA